MTLAMPHEDAPLVLRSASADDARQLYAWLNEPDSLAGKLETAGPVAWDAHVAWLSARLDVADCGIWIAERDGRALGQVRAERKADSRLHVDIYVASHSRGAGVGLAMLTALAGECASRWPGEALVARVRSDNGPSRRLFERAGYALRAQAPDYAEYVSGGAA